MAKPFLADETGKDQFAHLAINLSLPGSSPQPPIRYCCVVILRLEALQNFRDDRM
ncbi:MAG: hypothetical protein NVS4B8_30570 [Herpetosiphon sp.]